MVYSGDAVLAGEILVPSRLTRTRASATMLLVSATVGPFKSIDKPETVSIEEAVTVLVGMNEAGKTVFLQALEKSADVLNAAGFSLFSVRLEAAWNRVGRRGGSRRNQGKSFSTCPRL